MDAHLREEKFVDPQESLLREMAGRAVLHEAFVPLTYLLFGDCNQKKENKLIRVGAENPRGRSIRLYGWRSPLGKKRTSGNIPQNSALIGAAQRILASRRRPKKKNKFEIKLAETGAGKRKEAGRLFAGAETFSLQNLKADGEINAVSVRVCPAPQVTR